MTPNQNPEQIARDKIDMQLIACGWVIQNKSSLSLNLSRRRLERIMYLLRQLQLEKTLNIKSAASQFDTTEKNIRRDMLLLEKKGWIISGGTTSNRDYRLSNLAIEHLDNLKNED